MEASQKATLYGLGVGPGDPELLTVKSYRLLQECPVIAYPNKAKGEKSYALDIVELYVDPATKTLLPLVFPMTRDESVLREYWEKTVESVHVHLQAGRDVAFVTEGDPMLYSTFIHMARLMREMHPGTPVLSLPGVSSVTAAASRLGVPLADGDEVVAIVPATTDVAAMRQALVTHDCVVFLKVAKVLELLLDLVSELGLADKTMVCSMVTSVRERVWTTVSELRGATLPYLTLMVVRK